MHPGVETVEKWLNFLSGAAPRTPKEAAAGLSPDPILVAHPRRRSGYAQFPPTALGVKERNPTEERKSIGEKLYETYLRRKPYVVRLRVM